MDLSRNLWGYILILLWALTFLVGCSENKTTNPYGRGSIVGTVEPKGCGAKVVALQGKPVDSTWVDKEGYYRIDGLRVGTYFLRLSAPGYSSYTSKEVTVSDGAITTVPLITLSAMPAQITSTHPRDGDRRVPLANYISLSFLKAMDEGSVESSFSIDPPLEGEFVWQGGSRNFRYQPNFSLIPETTYTVTLTRGAQTEEGESLSFDYSFSFTTDRIRVESTHPTAGEKDVELWDHITIRFNSEMDHSSTKDALSIDPPLSCTYNWYSDFPYSGSRLNIEPNTPLRADTEYTIVIGEGARDVNGFGFKGPDSVRFSTEGLYLRYSSPSNGATDVPTKIYIRLSFNGWMEEESLYGALSFSPPVEGYFSSNYSPWGSEIRFQPGSPLTTSTVYTVKVSQAARDIYGTKLAEPDSFSFTTEPLRISSTHPVNGATWVDTTASISILFNTSVDQEKAESAFSIDPPAEGHFEWNSLYEFYFHPEGYLRANTTYTVQVDTSAQDIGGMKLPYPYRFSFTTRK